ncbi:hypothetical protein PV375_03735, partial [Gulosibacter sp. GYB002]|uniref:hypothetical protein n=1 Tax=Gulosibacter sp. GYB002 TaxID=2994391 RepID=UPI002F96A188
MESSTTPLRRRGAAALAVGAILGTSGVVGAVAIENASNAFAAGDMTAAQVTAQKTATEQAKLYQPVYTEVTVTEGEVAEVAAPKFTDEETGEERDMP